MLPLSGAKRKVLVCITPQSNSKRLIAKGHEAAALHQAELHILYVEKGNDIFLTEETPRLLESLFTFASGLGGIIHCVCGENIPDTIRKFIKDEKITDVVMGAPGPEDLRSFQEELTAFRLRMPEIHLIVIEKEL